MAVWRLKTQVLTFARTPRVMGIVNVTPDSFSDGGRFLNRTTALDHALMLDAQGADILDVGGESTRPYSETVSESEELDRTIPVVEAIAARTDTPVSIDTSKAKVAREAIAAGAEIVNDITGLDGDPEMTDVARTARVGVCAMHMQGTPQTMQDAPSYQHVTNEIFQYLRNRRDRLIESGIFPDQICLDPGIGFGKTHQHNRQLINECERFLELDCPILVGHSRKGFIGHAIGDKQVDRDYGTLAVSLRLAQKGIQIIRVHNVQATVEGLQVFAAVGGLDNRAD